MEKLLNYSLEELKTCLQILGEKPFRAKQIYEWLYSCVPFEQMSNLSRELRRVLREKYMEGYLRQIQKKVSKDGTAKYLFGLEDGQVVESVLMRYEYGNTVCISTQAGCRMGCAFCASCRGGLKRNLEPGEILGQVLAVNADLGEGRNITNIVLMGTGEPLDNYENVVKFLRLVHAPEGMNISFRNISLSTCGLVPEIERFCGEGLPVTLCISLHASTQKKRERIMPIAKKYDICQVVEAAKGYYDLTHRRLIFEYILLQGVNDTKQDIEQLSKLLKGVCCNLNIIPYNSTGKEEFLSPTRKRAQEFAGWAKAAGINATVRRSLGTDIDGACGQLRSRYMKETRL